MKIEIYALTAEGALNLDSKVADIDHSPDGVEIACFDARRERLLRRLFNEEVSVFVVGSDDGVKRSAAGSDEALQQVLEHELRTFGLGYRRAK